MLSAPLPHNEEKRLAALRQILVLYTPRQHRFDRIVEYAAERFRVPIASISLVDKDKVWCKSVKGLPRNTNTSRSISFCSHAILKEELMVLENAILDNRFYDSPIVTGSPFIRFYAAAPLLLPSGLNLGTLCVLDQKPRQFSRQEYEILRNLRDIVVTELLHPDADKGQQNFVGGSLDEIMVFVDLLHTHGIFEALKFLNARTPFRYTGLYRFNGDQLQNIYLVDKYDGSVSKGRDEAAKDAFCSFLPSVLELQVSPSASHHLIPGSPVKSYCGALLEDEQGGAYGSLCHFDTEPCEANATDLSLLKLATAFLYKAVKSVQ